MDFLWEVELLEQCQYFRNSVQLEKNILSGSVDMSHPSLGLVSQDAKSCIHCRYTKCINIGMKPELLKGKRKKDVQRRATVAEERDDIESDEEITSTSTELEQEKNNSEGLLFIMDSLLIN